MPIDNQPSPSIYEDRLLREFFGGGPNYRVPHSELKRLWVKTIRKVPTLGSLIYNQDLDNTLRIEYKHLYGLLNSMPADLLQSATLPFTQYNPANNQINRDLQTEFKGNAESVLTSQLDSNPPTKDSLVDLLQSQQLIGNYTEWNDLSNKVIEFEGAHEAAEARLAALENRVIENHCTLLDMHLHGIVKVDESGRLRHEKLTLDQIQTKFDEFHQEARNELAQIQDEELAAFDALMYAPHDNTQIAPEILAALAKRNGPTVPLDRAALLQQIHTQRQALQANHQSQNTFLDQQFRTFKESALSENQRRRYYNDFLMSFQTDEIKAQIRQKELEARTAQSGATAANTYISSTNYQPSIEYADKLVTRSGDLLSIDHTNHTVTLHDYHRSYFQPDFGRNSKSRDAQRAHDLVATAIALQGKPGWKDITFKSNKPDMLRSFYLEAKKQGLDLDHVKFKLNDGPWEPNTAILDKEYEDMSHQIGKSLDQKTKLKTTDSKLAGAYRYAKDSGGTVVSGVTTPLRIAAKPIELASRPVVGAARFGRAWAGDMASNYVEQKGGQLQAGRPSVSGYASATPVVARQVKQAGDNFVQSKVFREGNAEQSKTRYSVNQYRQHLQEKLPDMQQPERPHGPRGH